MREVDVAAIGFIPEYLSFSEASPKDQFSTSNATSMTQGQIARDFFKGAAPLLKSQL